MIEHYKKPKNDIEGKVTADTIRDGAVVCDILLGYLKSALEASQGLNERDKEMLSYEIALLQHSTTKNPVGHVSQLLNNKGAVGISEQYGITISKAFQAFKKELLPGELKKFRTWDHEVSMLDK